MKKLKLSSTLRDKKRYLAVRFKDTSREDLESAVLDFLGELGFAKSAMQVVKISEKGAIISVNRDYVQPVKASLALMQKQVVTKGVSGTLKGLQRFL